MAETLDRIFTACDRYTTDPDLLAEGGYYTEDGLRVYVACVVSEYEGSGR